MILISNRIDEVTILFSNLLMKIKYRISPTCIILLTKPQSALINK